MDESQSTEPITPALRSRPLRLSRAAKLGGLAGLGVVTMAVVWWSFRHYGGEVGEWVQLGLAKVRSAGAFTFFAVMAVLPSFGCPMSVFTLTVGPVFVPALGMPLVLGLTLCGTACNLALSYWLSNRALRPILARLVAWLGYTLPKVREEDFRTLVFLLRVTPGPPFFLQSYLLGLAGIPFRIYFVISWLISGAYAVVFVLFGDALMHGHGKQIMLAVGFFAVLTITVQWLRRTLRKSRARVVDVKKGAVEP